MTSTSFTSLPLSKELLSSILALEYHAMTPIQAHSLPVILAGKDLLAEAKTGTGKTAAFAIGLLHHLDVQTYATQALVLCPTRELADQVGKEIRRLARALPNTKILTLCGGTPLGPQLASLAIHPHVVVGTPGRILKHLQKGSLRLDRLRTLVLDEADRMLDMGFQDDLMHIIGMAPKQRQTLLFSATIPDAVRDIGATIQIDPVAVRLENQHDDKVLRQVFYEVEKGDRTKTLVALLQHYHPESSLVFCNRKNQCQELADALSQQGFHVQALHGDIEQKQREQVLTQFANRSSSILIATDVAARGLDIKELPAVFNFELSPDPEVHLHRIGRTSRAGHVGLAISLFIPSELFRIKIIESRLNAAVKIEKSSSLKTGDLHSLIPGQLIPPMITLSINGGRKDKLRAGDILGALTADDQLLAKQIGKIDVFDNLTYIAVERSIAKQALAILSEGKIKGRKFRARKLH